nr:ABC transporter ATP-binding protein [Candidatus Fokinia solitaria]
MPNISLIKVAIPLLRERWKIASCILFTCITWVCLSTYQAQILKEIMNYVSSADFQSQKSSLFYILSWIFVCAAICINYVLNHYLMNIRFIPSVKKMSYERVMSQLLHVSLPSYNNIFSGTVSMKVGDLAFGISEFFATAERLITPCIFFLIASCVLSKLSLLLGLSSFALSCVFIISNTMYLRISVKAADDAWRATSNIHGTIVDILSNIWCVITNSFQKNEKKNIANMTSIAIRKEVKFQTTVIPLMIFFSGWYVAVFCGGLYFLFIQYRDHVITIGDFALFFSLIGKCFGYLWKFMAEFIKMSRLLGRISQAVNDIGQICNTYDVSTLLLQRAPNTDYDTKLPYAYASDSGDNIIFLQKIVLQRGHFVMKLDELSIKKQEKVAIIGATGSGKTTLANIMLHIISPDSGSVITKHHNKLLQYSAIITQNSTLFHRTIMENITYGSYGVSKEDAIKMAHMVGIAEHIEKLEKKYDSIVGEKGIKLSGGQKQMILLIRALLRKDTDLIIFDEATSQMDKITEKKVLNAICENAKEKTVIFITHRDSYMQYATRVIEMANGAIVKDVHNNAQLKA